MHTNTHTERERDREQERARKNVYSGMNSLNSIFNGILLYFVYSRHTQKSIELTMHINVTIGVACCVCVCRFVCVCLDRNCISQRYQYREKKSLSVRLAYPLCLDDEF